MPAGPRRAFEVRQLGGMWLRVINVKRANERVIVTGFDKNDTQLRNQCLELHVDSVPALIEALTYVTAGPLTRLSMDAERNGTTVEENTDA